MKKIPYQLVVLAFAVCFATACERPEVRELTPIEVETKQEVQVEAPEQQAGSNPASNSPAGKWLDESEFPIEQWHVHYVNGKQVGYYKTTLSKGETLFRIHRTGVFEIATQAGALPKQYSIELESFEYPNGEFASFSEVTHLESSSTEISGNLIGDRLNLEMVSETSTTRKTLNWKPGTWGVLGIQSMLKSDPIQPGELRTCEIFVPKLNQIVAVELTALQPEQTALPGRQMELIPVEATLRAGDQSSRSRNWVDDQGVIHKTVALGSQMVSSFLAPPRIGKQVADEMRLRLLWGRKAKFYGTSPSPAHRSATYIIEGGGSTAYKDWDSKGRQAVKSLSALTTQVNILDTTNLAELDWGASPADAADVEAEYLASSKWMPIEHASIQRIATNMRKKSSITEDPTVEQVLFIAKELRSFIAESPASPVFATPLDTARRLRGDRKDQALLLASVLRGVGLPTRLAFGLKLDAIEARMEPYLWTEVKLAENNWLSVDSATAKAVGVDCIKMFDSAFVDENPYPLMLKLLAAIESISVRMVESK